MGAINEVLSSDRYEMVQDLEEVYHQLEELLLSTICRIGSLIDLEPSYGSGIIKNIEI